MSFIGNVEQGKAYAPGWFLAHEECERKTFQMVAEGAESRADGAKYVPMGTIYKVDDAVVGIVYEDVDVTSGDMPGSVVVKGSVYEDRLPETLGEEDKEALVALGFTFATVPEVTRPEV